MLSASRYLLALVAAGSLAPIVGRDLSALAAAGGPNPVLLTKGILALAPGALAVALVGRTALAFLPPGEPGSHRGRSIAATWAASHFLGTAFLALELRLLALVGLGPSPAVVLAPWTLAAIARIASLPAAPKPRRDPAAEGPRLAGTLVLLLALAAAALPLVLWASPAVERVAPDGPLAGLYAALAHGRFARDLPPPTVLAWPSLLVLVAHSLASGRRAPLGRRLLVLLAALVPFAIAATRREPGVLELPLFFGAGCSFLVPWLRRADRRAACLSAAGFAACGLVSPSGLLLGAGGIACLWLATPVASKLFASTAGVTALGAVALPGVLNGDLFVFGRRVAWDLMGSLTRAPHRTGYWTLRELLGGGNDPAQWGLAWALIPVVIAVFVVLRLSRARTSRPESVRGVEPPGRELWTLLGVGAAGFVIHLALAAWVYSTGEPPWIAGDDSNAALLTLLPAALLAVGLIAVRPEDPKGARRRAAAG